MTGFTTSASLEIVREILFRRDLAARETQPEGLTRERLDLRSVALESVRVEVLAHHGRGVLELGLQPWRSVREALLGRGEAVVGGAERLGEALGDPRVCLPGLASDDDQMLGRKRARLAKVLLLDRTEVREQAGDGSALGMVGLRARRTVDGLQLPGDQHVRQRPA